MAEKQDVWRRLGTATRVLNTEIRKEIIRQKAVDTTRMRNVTRIIKLRWEESKDDVDMEISSTFYYHGISKDGTKWKEGGVDVRKASKWKGGKVNRNISQAFMKREKVKQQIEALIKIIFEYRIDQQFR